MTIDLNAYLQKSIQINSVEELFHHYDTTLDSMGYQSSVFIFFAPKKDADEVVPICPFFNIEPELINFYLSHRLYQVGPIFERAKTTGRPVIWSDFFKDPKQFEKSKDLIKFINLLKQYGYNDGITIPTFGFSNSFGHFSFSHKNSKINMDDPNIVILNHICINLFRQYLRITHVDEGVSANLTVREKEVLGWVLKGKSNNVIGDIMGISEHTVTTYIRRSSKKLGASSKWSAAITAVLIGYIQY